MKFINSSNAPFCMGYFYQICVIVTVFVNLIMKLKLVHMLMLYLHDTFYICILQNDVSLLCHTRPTSYEYVIASDEK